MQRKAFHQYLGELVESKAMRSVGYEPSSTAISTKRLHDYAYVCCIPCLCMPAGKLLHSLKI